PHHPESRSGTGRLRSGPRTGRCAGRHTAAKMIQTLIPAPVAAQAHAKGRFGRILNTTLTGRSLLLFLAGLLCAIPGFFGLRWLALMLAWDAAVLLLVVLEILSLPPAHSFRV